MRYCGHSMFLGREREKRVIRDLVAGVAQHGGALVVIGDPGIGKSALAGLARRFAIRQGLEVLATPGVPAESRLPYAGLHQLLRPLRDGIGDLPLPQRDALLPAFGQGTGHVPDRFLVALAVTDLLTAAAARQPLLLLADDAHWIDPPSCDVLAFLGRRVASAPIILLATARDGYPVPLLEAGFRNCGSRGSARKRPASCWMPSRLGSPPRHAARSSACRSETRLPCARRWTPPPRCAARRSPPEP